MPLIEGTAGNDSLVGGADSDTIWGYAGDDTLVGGNSVNVLIGGDGDDVYFLGPGLDYIGEEVDGGNDTAYLLFNGAPWIGPPNPTVLDFSWTGIENVIVSGVGRYYIYGSYDWVDNLLVGGSSDDILAGGGGVDTLIGGAGDDYYYAEQTEDLVIESIAGSAGGVDWVQADGSFTLGENVEHLLIAGGIGTGNALNNILTGGDGANILDGKGGVDTLSGGLGADTYILDSYSELLLVSGVEDPVRREDYDRLVLEFDTSSLITLNLDAPAYGGFEAVTLLGSGRFDAIGNNAANQLYGNASDNLLSGGTGNPWSPTDDTLIGGGGNDTLLGGDGVDFLEGGAGNDVLDGGLDDVGIIYGNWLDGGADNDTLTGGFRSDTLLGGDGGDSMDGGDAQDHLDGGSGNDVIAGGNGNDSIDGGAGIDTMRGGAGDDLYLLSDAAELGAVFENVSEGTDTLRLGFDDTMSSAIDLSNPQLVNIEHVIVTGLLVADLFGNESYNRLIAGQGDNFISGGGGGDWLEGGSGDDTLLGGGGSGSLWGGDGNDSLVGGSFGDYLDGGAGVDTLRGGGGDDRYYLSSIEELATVFEEGDGGIDILNIGFSVLSSIIIDLSAGDFDHFESIVVTGSGSFVLKGDQGNNTLTGGWGNDVLLGGLGEDHIDGGSGDDLIDGGDGMGWYNGGDGNDWLIGSAEFNSLTGGNGDDILDGRGGDDFLRGEYGKDTYYLYSQSQFNLIFENGDDADTVIVMFDSITNYSVDLTSRMLEHVKLVGSGDVNILGNNAENHLIGNSGNNVLNGAGGADILAGGLGNDTYIIDHSNDQVMELGNSGADLIQSTVSYNLMQAWHVEHLTLNGGSAINGLGNWQDNILTGNGVANTLDGNRGNDTLHGGDGADTLIGGLGDDVLVWDAADVSIQGGAGTDTLWIDSSGMTLNLTAIVDTRIRDVEVINLTGSGDNTLILALADVLAISSSTDRLRIDGDAGDAVDVVGNWSAGGSQTVGSQSYDIYYSATATLLVDSDITPI